MNLINLKNDYKKCQKRKLVLRFIKKLIKKNAFNKN